MSKSICSSQVSDDAFMIISLLVSLLIGDGCLLRLIDLDQGISIDLKVLECGHCLNDLIITFGISFSAFQVLKMNISQQLSALYKVSRFWLHSL